MTTVFVDQPLACLGLLKKTSFTDSVTANQTSVVSEKLLLVFTPTDYYRLAESLVRMVDEETREDV